MYRNKREIQKRLDKQRKAKDKLIGKVNKLKLDNMQTTKRKVRLSDMEEKMRYEQWRSKKRCVEHQYKLHMTTAAQGQRNAIN